MIPESFVNLDELPLTANGKVDRAALPAPSQPEVQQGHVAPRDAVEDAVAGIWSLLLDKRPIGAHDDFFELGGHSLLATQLVSRLRDLFRVDIPLEVVFTERTVEGISRHVQESLAHSRDRVLPVLRRLPRDGRLPMSFAQQRMFLIDQMEQGSAAYNITEAIRLEGRLDLCALAEAFNELPAGTRLCGPRSRSGGRSLQQISEASPVFFPLVDLSLLPERLHDAEARRLAEAIAALHFDLTCGPLLRVQLVHLHEKEHFLLLSMHHIISDGWSMGVLVRELAALYEARSHRRAPALPDLPIQYADYADWQRQVLQGSTLEALLGYWQHQLQGTRGVLDLATDHPRLPSPSSRSINVSLELSTGFSELLKRFSLRRSVHAVHDAAGGLPGAPVSAQRPDGSSRWGRRLRAAATPIWKTSSGSLSTRWCCARTCRATPRFASCWRGCATRPWAPTHTRTCPSRGSWRSWPPRET